MKPAQRRPERRRLLLGLTWAFAAFGVASVALGLFWANRAGFSVSLPWPVVLSGSLVGLAIVSRRPGSSFGWWLFTVCVVVDLTVGMEGFWYSFGATDPTPSSFAVWLWWVVQVVPSAMFVFFVVGLPLLFPTGRPPSARWNWVGWLALAVAGLAMAAWASAPNLCALPLDTDAIPLNPSADCAPPIASPWVWFSGGTASFVTAVWLPLLGVATVGAVGSMVARYRSGDTKERIQMKWYVVAMVASLVVLTVTETLGLPNWIGNVAYLLVPAALAVAILRHQLFEIDRLISRSVSYAVVVGALGATFALLVSLPGLLIGGVRSDGALSSAPPAVIAGATLVVSGLFNPLRRRTQSWVDRRFNRTRYIADRELEAFSNNLRHEPDISVLQDDLIAFAARNLEPSSIALWCRPDGSPPAIPEATLPTPARKATTS